VSVNTIKLDALTHWKRARSASIAAAKHALSGSTQGSGCVPTRFVDNSWNWSAWNNEPQKRELQMLILLILILLLVGGGGGYYGHTRWGYGGGAGIGLGTILIILLIAYMLGLFR
jgi:hypothetical protein